MLKLYNSLSGSIEAFESIEPKKVSMYVCGPTVYGDIHLGNARPVIFFDVVKRYLKFIDYDVLLVSNITDVDDKIIEKAKELKVKESELTNTYTKHFIDMTLALGSVMPDMMPKATEYIMQMVEYIEDLIKKGFAYAKPSGVYFRVGKVSDYGILSKQNMDELSQGVRVTLDEDKEDPRDFSIWKITTDGISFESPWGRGRPGWHTECAVMNHEIFGKEIDIHGGGTDLKFPHHENEIAQTVVHDHHHLARFWMHVGRLDVNDVKMSKSLGNITLVKDLLQDYDPFAFRLLTIGHHYRQPINYTDDLMVQFAKEYDKIKRNLKKAFLTISLAKEYTIDVDTNQIDLFKSLMDDDFNIPNVITQIYDLLKQMNKAKDSKFLAVLYQTTKTILEVLGIMPQYELTDETLILYRAWEDARNDKDFSRADQLRNKLTERGWM
ncbi:MAG: cysteine--tRNA ligase [Acholeplasmataceae bacterium]|nr:cysteine--tRNA ligase [Acholeplasmataceae bacterium]